MARFKQTTLSTTDEELRLIRIAAAKANLSVSQYVIQAALAHSDEPDSLGMVHRDMLRLAGRLKALESGGKS